MEGIVERQPGPQRQRGLSVPENGLDIVLARGQPFAAVEPDRSPEISLSVTGVGRIELGTR
jgi:hypothetical protein